MDPTIIRLLKETNPHDEFYVGRSKIGDVCYLIKTMRIIRIEILTFHDRLMIATAPASILLLRLKQPIQ